MNKDSVDQLLTLIGTSIAKQDTKMKEAIEPGLKLAITLHHLAERASHKSIAHHYRRKLFTVSQIIYDTCEAIYKVLQTI